MATRAHHTSASPNSNLSMSPGARQRLRSRENVRGYYNDLGGNRGNCTYGIGILVHRGPCSDEELQRPLSPAQVETSFAAIREAESAVRRHVTHQALTQDQFDGLVSYVFNTGANGAARTLQLIDSGRLDEAADVMSRNIRATVGRRRIVVHELIARRREESAPLRQSR